jgi:hypothetical protein
MARRKTHAVVDQPFQREGWSLGKQYAPLALRLLHLKRDALLAGIAVDATFTEVERDILERRARGAPVVGIDLAQHIAEYQMRWIAAGGSVHDDEDDSA